MVEKQPFVYSGRSPLSSTLLLGIPDVCVAIILKMDDFVTTYSLEIADKSTSSYQGSATVLLDDRLNFFTRVCLVRYTYVVYVYVYVRMV